MIDNKYSAEWQEVKKFCEEKIAEYREFNDSDLSENATARLRGKIEFAKEILGLEKKEESVKVKPVQYTENGQY